MDESRRAMSGSADWLFASEEKSTAEITEAMDDGMITRDKASDCESNQI